MEVIVAGSPTQIIGGYNPASWMSTDDFVTTPTEADRIAFIFNLISGTVLQQEAASDNGQYKSYNAASIGPVMGGENDIYVDSDLAIVYFSSFSYCINPALSCEAGTNVLGSTGFQSATVGALEVFTISAAEVPIPAAAPLLLGALGLTGWIARRRKG
ncbi:MAG: hypothetical protein ACJAVR_001724 [Paracoccaceae bacterium]|jgi:hypothetical protein